MSETILELNISPFLQLKNEAQSVRDQLLTHHIVVLNDSDTLDVALTRFNGAKIVSAPVKALNGTYKFLSVMDILAVIADNNSELVWSTPIAQLCNVSQLSDYAAINIDSTMKQVINLLADKHRVLITEDGVPINIISQMDVVSYLSRNLGQLPEGIGRIPVGHLMTENPKCVGLNDRTYTAFLDCLKNQFYGIGVVDDNGVLKANISVSSLKGISPQNFNKTLQLPVKDFLEMGQNLVKLPIVCQYGEVLSSVIKKIGSNHVHRIYVVDNEGKPIGVISTTDIMKIIANNSETRK